ncbi:MAG: hypothetical protein AAF721_33750 [Myxococcota bacterium]
MMSATACKAPASGTSPPRSNAKAAPPVETIDEAERALSDNERRLSELGIVPPSRSLDGGGDGGASSVSGDEDEAEAAPIEDDSAVEESVTAQTDVGAASSSGPDRGPRCNRICDLAESTCALAQQVCELATRHEGDERYESACAQATLQCESASDACDHCE